MIIWRLSGKGYTTVLLQLHRLEVSLVMIPVWNITIKQVWEILKRIEMKYTEPYSYDERKSATSDNVLKNLDWIFTGDSITGFMDETSSQTSSNTIKLYFFNKPETMKGT